MIMVPSEGPKECLMAFVGEAPGRDEERESRPFIGYAGQKLNGKLHLLGIARQQCYITNIFKIRPGTFHAHRHELGYPDLKAPKNDNDFSIFWVGSKPTQALIDARDALLKELDDIKTNVIVALGANPLWALTNQHKIGKWRGSILQCTLPSGRKIKVIGTYHPVTISRPVAYKLPDGKKKYIWTGPIIQIDLRKALKQSKFPELILPQRRLLTAPTYDDALTYISDCPLETSFDIETSPSGITCCSFAFTPNEAMSIPTTRYYWGDKLKSVLEMMDWHLSRGQLKIGQNMPFDIQYLMRFFNILPKKPWYDTMIAQHACYCEMLKSLAYLTSIYTDEPYYKDDLKVWQSGVANDEMLWQYNAKDAAVTLEVKHRLDQEMDELQVRPTFDYMMNLLEPFLFMMLRGLKVDQAMIKSHENQYSNDLKQREEDFEKAYGTVNPHSHKQMAKLAYETLGLAPVMKKGKVTTDKKALEKLAIKSPEMAKVIDIRHGRKMISTYINVPLDPIDGRLRFSLNSTGAETGRPSSDESVFGSGTDLQNWPKKLRNIVIPDEGMVFTEADLKGAEAMFVAYRIDDPLQIKLFEDGKNIHTSTANMIWNVDEAQVKANKEKFDKEGRDTESMYYKAKRVRHSGNYRASWVSLAEQLKIPAAEAKKLLHKFHTLTPNLSKWHKEIEKMITNTRTLITAMGRKRIFFGEYGPELFKEATAYEPQEVIAHVLNLGLINIYEHLCKKHKEISLCLQVYDSVLLQHPPLLTPFIHEKLKELMKIEITTNGRTFTIPVSIKTGENWRDLK